MQRVRDKIVDELKINMDSLNQKKLQGAECHVACTACMDCVSVNSGWTQVQVLMASFDQKFDQRRVPGFPFQRPAFGMRCLTL